MKRTSSVAEGLCVQYLITYWKFHNRYRMPLYCSILEWTIHRSLTELHNGNRMHLYCWSCVCRVCHNTSGSSTV